MTAPRHPVKTLPAVSLAVMAFSMTMAMPARAQDIPPPTPPFVAPVPENCDWIVAREAPLSGAGGPALPRWLVREVHSTKTGNIKRDRITLGDGSTQECWYVDSLFFYRTSSGDAAAMRAEGDSDQPGALEASLSVPSGFPCVGWITRKDFQSVVVREKRPCYHYVSGNREAWIDTETRLPVACKDGDALYVFRFNPPPQTALTLPAIYREAEAISRKAEERRKRLEKDLLAR